MNQFLEIEPGSIPGLLNTVQRKGVVCGQYLSSLGVERLFKEAKKYVPSTFTQLYMGPFKEDSSFFDLAREWEELLNPHIPSYPDLYEGNGILLDDLELIKYAQKDINPDHRDPKRFINLAVLCSLSGEADFWGINGDEVITMPVKAGSIVIMKRQLVHGVEVTEPIRYLLSLRQTVRI